ncbi:MAG: hypothetical protein JNM58_00640 [Xanthomonadaceae bacterium]|nr:hypothetical protein [Xanthomonadaceae bacterium]
MNLPLPQPGITPETVLAALLPRLGEANGITASQLAFALTARQHAADERSLRKVIEHLRRQGHEICALPRAGYYMAANAEDLERACVFLVDRAMTSLSQAAAMRRVAVPNLYGQLGLPMPDTTTEG